MLPRSAFRFMGALLVLSAWGVNNSQAQVSFYGAPVPPPATTETTTTTSEISATTPGAVAPAPDTSKETPAVGQGIFEKSPFTFLFTVREGFDDNVFTSNDDRHQSFYTNWAAGIGYNFGNDRLQFNAGLNGGVTYYYTRPGDKVDFNGQFNFAGTYLATPRLTITFNNNTAYLSQPDLTIQGSTNRQDGDYFYDSTAISAAYQWSEKFSTVTSYEFSALWYMDHSLNDQQGHIEQTIGQSARWLILPKTTGVLEYRAQPYTYFNADLNVFNNYFLIGFDQVFSPRFTWNLRVGAQLGIDQNPDDGSSIYLGPYGESTVTYQYGAASNVSLLLRYGTEASGLADVTQRQTFRIGLTVNQAITARIAANLGFSYQNSQYNQDNVADFNESIFAVQVGLTYSINRFASLSAGYQFTADLAPSYTGRDYTRDVVFIGADFTF